MLFFGPEPDPEIAAAQRGLQAAATKRLAAVIVARVRGPRDLLWTGLGNLRHRP
jgi:hypothetical protein